MKVKLDTISDLAVIALCLVTIVFVASRPKTLVVKAQTATDPAEACIEATDDEVAVNENKAFVRDTLADLALAFAMVESTDNPKAYNASSGATGWLQFKKIMVDEANRIQNINKKTSGVEYYSYDDRWSREKSEEMFKVVMRHRNPKYDIKKACEIWKYDYGQGYIDAVTRNYKQIVSNQGQTS